METNLSGKKVAIVVTNGFEQSEFEEPLKSLKKAGAKVDIVSIKKEKVKGWKDKNWGDEFEVDLAIDSADSNNYDALVLPGGVMNPDALRTNADALLSLYQRNPVKDKRRIAITIAA
ncbi:general stress protein 18 domain protein, partial [Ostertagia ostertagi]